MLTGRQCEILRWCSDAKNHRPADASERHAFESLESKGLLERSIRGSWHITKSGHEAVKARKGNGS